MIKQILLSMLMISTAQAMGEMPSSDLIERCYIQSNAPPFDDTLPAYVQRRIKMMTCMYYSGFDVVDGSPCSGDMLFKSYCYYRRY